MININEHGFPQIMGILNCTPDSFSDGGDFADKNKAIEHALEMIELGADYIDVGGESTRPGADTVEDTEEIARTTPVIEGIRKHNANIPISIDTTKYTVAASALDAGANIINDISGLNFEPKLVDLAARKKAGLVIMHMKGKPKTMQNKPNYCDISNEIYLELQEKVAMAKRMGVENVIADVGIGFGKTVTQNWLLLRLHYVFESLGVPLMLGLSRKFFIGETFGIENPKDRDFETAIIHTMLLTKKIDIIRVHNIEKLNRVRDIFKNLF